MSDLPAVDRGHEIMAQAIFVPLQFDPRTPRRHVPPGMRQHQLAQNIEQHQQRVRQNIAHLALSTPPPSHFPQPSGITKEDTDKLAAALDSRVPYRPSKPPTKPPNTSQVHDPAFYPLVLNQDLQSLYNNHAKQVKHSILTSHDPARLQSRPIPPPQTPKTGPGFGSSILTTRPSLPRSATVQPQSAAPPAAQMVAPGLPPASSSPTVVPAPSSAAAPPPRPSTTEDAPGRRQEVGPSVRARRRSLGDVRGVERVEGFFAPGQPARAGAGAAAGEKRAGGSEVFPERDPRRRRTGQW
ncbi:hypothetical protein BDZ85DRAFT_17099 [Elsinoe ampelina]|uniref:Uncharacterized protein n=1 Tax=Elsinoe ampelina TaxID=302913 RepID=A0A6A6G6Q5_9PEZI|nr:hypothetical protein BDZ85DRAFT_17099 [Elsinoe ampelina]